MGSATPERLDSATFCHCPLFSETFSLCSLENRAQPYADCFGPFRQTTVSNVCLNLRPAPCACDTGLSPLEMCGPFRRLFAPIRMQNQHVFGPFLHCEKCEILCFQRLLGFVPTIFVFPAPLGTLPHRTNSHPAKSCRSEPVPGTPASPKHLFSGLVHAFAFKNTFVLSSLCTTSKHDFLCFQ